jgi:beta-lactamase class A
MPYADLLSAAGCRGSVHAVTLDGSRQSGLDPDEPQHPASSVKVLLALEVEAQLADGRLDRAERVRLTAADRVPGFVGLSFFEHDADLALGDLVTLLLTLSDNVATDRLLARVGAEAVNARAEQLGLTATGMDTGVEGLLADVAAHCGYRDWASFTAADIPDQAALHRQVADALRPGPWRTTARDQTTLLRAIWCDEAGPAEACHRVRVGMSRQLTRTRIAAGFRRDTAVAAKSGSLLGVLRNEVGVVTPPGGRPFAVAVMTRTDELGADGRAVDAAIGAVAAEAVAALS